MKMYMAYDNFQGCAEGACLVFANTAKEARKIAAGTIINWFGGEWINVRVKWLNEHEYLSRLSISDKAHVIENPNVCPRCELWGTGEVENGSCPECNHSDL